MKITIKDAPTVLGDASLIASGCAMWLAACQSDALLFAAAWVLGSIAAYMTYVHVLPHDQAQRVQDAVSAYGMEIDTVKAAMRLAAFLWALLTPPISALVFAVCAAI